MSTPLNSNTKSSGLWNRQFAYAISTSFGLYLGYQCLIVLTPYYVFTLGASNTIAGLVTAATMLAATTTPLAMVGLLARYDARLLLLVSMFLLAIPSLLTLLTNEILFIALLHFVRGIGFGMAAVGCGTVISILAPPARRGTAMGWWGFTGGTTTVIGPSAGLFLANSFDFGVVFFATALITLFTAVLIFSLRPIQPVSRSDSTGRRQSILTTLKNQRLSLPLLIFIVTALTYGAVITFAPLYLFGDLHTSPAVFFLILGSVFSLSRLFGGIATDHIGPIYVLTASFVLSGFSMFLLASAPFSGAAFLAAAIYGVGFGISATTAQFTLVSRVNRESYGTANSLFTLAFNGGIGTGGILFGLVAQITDYASMFLFTILCFVVAGVLLIVDQNTRQ